MRVDNPSVFQKLDWELNTKICFHETLSKHYVKYMGNGQGK